jgi:uncharacterized membrane protein YesL
MTERQTHRGGRRRSWENRALAALAYPANLAFAGVAAFVLALPVVTWLAAAVAAGRALHRWQVHQDDRVFTGTFREFAATWRRTLPASVVATIVVFLLVVNMLFLRTQNTPIAFLFGMATVPVAVAAAMLALYLTVAAALAPDESMRGWIRAAVALAAARPVGSLLLVALSGAVVMTCVLLPTIAPFFGFSVPIWLALVTARASRPSAQ